MKKDAVLARYRIKDDEAIKPLGMIGMKAESYSLPINGVDCKVIILKEFNDVHLSASIILGDGTPRFPNYGECLKIKEFLFEEDENLVFGICPNNILLNMCISNPYAIHMYTYEGELPPIEKIKEIEDFKKDGDFKITKGRWGGWYFVKISGNYYPDMDELKSLKAKYVPNDDVAVFLIEDAVIMFRHPKNGIKFHMMTLK